MDNDWDFDRLACEVLKNPTARRAYKENQLRRELADKLRRTMAETDTSIRHLATKMESSVSQVQRLLNNEGGSVTLSTMVRALDALDLDLELHFRETNSS